MKTTARVPEGATAEGTSDEGSAALEGADSAGEIEGDSEARGQLSSGAGAPAEKRKTEELSSRSGPDG
jgi:hypothetical protein